MSRTHYSNGMQPQGYNFDPNPAQTRQRKVIKLAAAGLGFILLLSLVAALFGGNSASTGGLGGVVARNTEMLRVAKEYGKTARSTILKNNIAQIAIVSASDNAALAAIGAVATPEQLLTAQSIGIDEALSDAASNNRYDQALDEYFSNVLAANKRDLTEALANAKTEAAKATIELALENIENLP